MVKSLVYWDQAKLLCQNSEIIGKPLQIPAFQNVEQNEPETAGFTEHEETAFEFARNKVSTCDLVDILIFFLFS
jgi:hypothetical protein